MQLSIENVINISVSQAGQGAGEYNTSNLAVFTEEAPASSFGTDGYKLYLEPTEVGVDFGTNSKTYKMALAVFSQQPNILAGGGYLVVIPFIAEKQTVSFATVPNEGSFVLNFGGDATAAINYNDTLEQVQTKIRTLAGLESAKVTGSFAAGFVVEFQGYYGNAALMTVSSNTLKTSSVASSATVTETVAGEKIDAAISRTDTLVQYFGLVSTVIPSQVDLLAAAAVVQPLNKIAAFGSKTAADVEVGGALDLLRTGGLYKTRGLFYGGSTDLEALVFVASYMGRALSTNFSGSNTTQTMHLKDLVGVQPDPSMTQTLLNKCQAAGADTYISIQGVSKVFTSGENRFFDDVYNLMWFVGALKIAGFNVLAQSGTKIAQTEAGMDSLKSAYREICEQAVGNQFVAAGRWTNPTTFGVQQDLFDNISQRGYYMYSLPVSLQTPADRAARKAPLVQLAIKYAGAIHSSSVIVNVNQ